MSFEVGSRVQYFPANEHAEARVIGWTGTVVTAYPNAARVKWDQAQPNLAVYPHNQVFSWNNANLKLIDQREPEVSNPVVGTIEKYELLSYLDTISATSVDAFRDKISDHFGLKASKVVVTLEFPVRSSEKPEEGKARVERSLAFDSYSDNITNIQIVDQ